MRKLALLLLSASAFANGVLEVRPVGAVRLDKHSVDATIKGQLATVTVEQTFFNTTNRRIEGIYRFPLPPRASVARFAMTMNGKMVEGEIMERTKARKVYQGIVNRKRDPGLLEMVEKGLFRARVFPIEPGKPTTIRVVYRQVLMEHDGLREFRYPLANARLGSKEKPELRVRVTVDSLQVSCASHRASIEADEAMSILTWTGKAPQDKDLLLHAARLTRAAGMVLKSHRAAAEPGTFLAVFSPPIAGGAPVAKDVIFVLDTSGSMEHRKLAQAKRALKHGIANLGKHDRFNVIAFSSTTRAFREAPVGPEARDAAAQWIDALQAKGGTAIDEALRTALAQVKQDRLTQVVFLTDGLPTIGEQDPKTIVSNVKKANPFDARVFVFGIGFDQNVGFLDEIASMTRGAREYVAPNDNLEFALKRFFDRIHRPVLTDLRLVAKGTRGVQPHALPDLFAGEPLLVTGRYDKPGPRLFRLTGKLAGKDVAYDFEGVLGDKPGAPDLPRLWAQQTIDFLLAQRPSEELRKEIVALATKHSIVTKYTSGLVVEDGEAVDPDVELEETAGVDGLSDQPFVGPSSNSSIGLGGGAGGSTRGRSGRRSLRAGGGSGIAEKLAETEVGRNLAWLSKQPWTEQNAGLALLAYLGAGYTDRGATRDNRYAGIVRRGLRQLMAAQTADGTLYKSLRVHAINTLALSEAYWMTRNPRYRKPAQAALYRLGTWVRKEKLDPKTLAWAIMATRSGMFAGLEVDPDSFELFRRALEKSTPETMLIGGILLGEDPRQSARLREAADQLLVRPPADAETWQFATLGMFQLGGKHWKEWNKRLKKWAQDRPNPPALADVAHRTVCLEVYYRYDRVFGTK